MNDPKARVDAENEVEPGAQPAPDPTADPSPDAGGGGGEAAGEGGKGATGTFRENTATIMAVVVIVALGVLYGFMLWNVDAKQLHWERAMIILSGVEAIVFGAAGFLFGTSIQRKATQAEVKVHEKQADEARKQAEDAREKEQQEKARAELEAAKAEAANEKATEGKMLAAALMVHTGAAAGTEAAGAPMAVGGPGEEAPAAGVEGLQQLAQRVLS